ncbi:hypothetical protein IBR38_000365, partial [Neisseria gonorrhoeae]
GAGKIDGHGITPKEKGYRPRADIPWLGKNKLALNSTVNLIQIYFLGHTQSQSCKNTFVVIQCPNSHIQRYGSVFMAMNIVDAPTIPIDRLLGSYFRNTAIRINK